MSFSKVSNIRIQDSTNNTTPSIENKQNTNDEINDEMDRFQNKGDKNKLVAYAEWYHIAAMGILPISAGLYDGWNGLVANGFGNALISTFIVGWGYLALVSCLAELTSAIPLSGGSYGFALVLLGRWSSVIVGLFEFLSYLFTTVLITSVVAQCWTSVLGTDPYLECLWYVLIYFSMLILCLMKGKWFWNMTIVFVIINTILALIICIAIWSHPDTSFSKYAKMDTSLSNSDISTYFSNGVEGFFSVLPIGMSFYSGIEGLPLAAEDTVAPRKAIPKGMIVALLLYAAEVFAILFTFVSMPPGMSNLADNFLPMAAMAQTLWPVDENQKSLFIQNWAVTVFTTFNLHFTLLGFLFTASRQVYSIARGGHAPFILSKTLKNGTPYAATIFVCIFGIILSCYCRISHDYDQALTTIFNCLIFTALVTYFFMLSSYMSLRLKFNSMQRVFQSPLGIPGAISSAIIFALCLIGVLVFTPNIQQGLIITFVCFTFGILYYALLGRKSLILSPEERLRLYMEITAEKMLSSSIGYQYLHAFCASEHSTENVEVWQQINESLQKYNEHKHSTSRNYAAEKGLCSFFNKLYESSIRPNSKNEINLPSWLITKSTQMNTSLLSHSEDKPIELINSLCALFILIQDELCKLLNADTLARFKNSPHCIRYLNQEPLLFAKTSVSMQHTMEKIGNKNVRHLFTADNGNQTDSPNTSILKSTNQSSIKALPMTRGSTIESTQKSETIHYSQNIVSEPGSASPLVVPRNSNLEGHPISIPKNLLNHICQKRSISVPAKFNDAENDRKHRKTPSHSALLLLNNDHLSLRIQNGEFDKTLQQKLSVNTDAGANDIYNSNHTLLPNEPLDMK